MSTFYELSYAGASLGMVRVGSFKPISLYLIATDSFFFSCYLVYNIYLGLTLPPMAVLDSLCITGIEDSTLAAILFCGLKSLADVSESLIEPCILRILLRFVILVLMASW